MVENVDGKISLTVTTLARRTILVWVAPSDGIGMVKQQVWACTGYEPGTLVWRCSAIAFLMETIILTQSMCPAQSSRGSSTRGEGLSVFTLTSSITSEFG